MKALYLFVPRAPGEARTIAGEKAARRVYIALAERKGPGSE